MSVSAATLGVLGGPMITTTIAAAIAILASVASAGAVSTVLLMSWLREERYRSEVLEDRLTATSENLNNEVRRESLTLQGLLERVTKPGPAAQSDNPRG